MGINIKEFRVEQNTDDRKVRDLINTPQGTIEIYEPTFEDVTAIIDLQNDEDFMEDGKVYFNGATVIRGLFPILTNIDLGDLSDEELEDVIENPSVHLLIAQQVVAQIVTEANRLHAERVRAELLTTENTLAQAELMSTIPTYVMEKAKGDDEISELVEKLEEAHKSLEEAIQNEENENDTKEPDNIVTDWVPSPEGHQESVDDTNGVENENI